MNYQGIAQRASCVGNSFSLPSCQSEVPKTRGDYKRLYKNLQKEYLLSGLATSI